MPDTNAIITQPAHNAQALTAATVESVMLGGDLSKLTPQQRVAYIGHICDGLGINKLTRPFEYITLNGKLTLYARKDATDQLRKIHGISIDKPDISFQDDWIIVSIVARTPEGRTDADTGVVSRKDMRGDFGNSLMKAVTKAKRRVTLSICGLGMLDETEVETIPSARPVAVNVETGELPDVDLGPDAPPPPPNGTPGHKPSNVGDVISQAQGKRLWAIAKGKGWTQPQVEAFYKRCDVAHTADIKRADYEDIIAAIESGPAACGIDA